jgi:hypothetical protein
MQATDTRTARLQEGFPRSGTVELWDGACPRGEGHRRFLKPPAVSSLFELRVERVKAFEAF